MEVPQSHMNCASASNTSDNSTLLAADCNVAPSGYRLMRDEDMIPRHSGGAQVDHANALLNLDDLEQLDWEPPQHSPCVLVGHLQCLLTSQVLPIQFPTVVDQSEESSTETRGEDAKNLSAQSAECGGECSYHHIDESTSRPVLPSGKKIGVSYHKKQKQWEAHLWIKGPQLLRGHTRKGVQIFLGNFGTEKEAKMAHDRAAIKLKIPPSAKGKPYPLNFPAAVHASYMEEHAQWTTRDFLWKIRRTSNKFSKGKSSLKGVTVRKRSLKRGQEWTTKYESKLSLTVKEIGDDLKRTFELGNFESEEEAGRAYDRALLYLHKHLPEVEQLRCVTNFRPSSYSAEDIKAMASQLSCQLSEQLRVLLNGGSDMS